MARSSRRPTRRQPACGLRSSRETRRRPPSTAMPTAGRRSGSAVIRTVTGASGKRVAVSSCRSHVGERHARAAAAAASAHEAPRRNAHWRMPGPDAALRRSRGGRRAARISCTAALAGAFQTCVARQSFDGDCPFTRDAICVLWRENGREVSRLRITLLNYECAGTVLSTVRTAVRSSLPLSTTPRCCRFH